jgi:FkbM family methyltransferase
MRRPSWLREQYRYSKRLCRAFLNLNISASVQIRCNKVCLGNDHARWCISPIGISPLSVVYSFGIGQDVSFDLELIRRFGVCVHAFDPTPRSIEWLKLQKLPEQFVFHDYGLADYDGIATFNPPENSAHVSYSVFPSSNGSGLPVKAPVRRLTTIMQTLDHRSIDLLKMDIEGAEYSVISDLLSSHVQVDQLLVEFHHGRPEIGLPKTRQIVEKLNSAGFRIFDVSPSGEEFSFKKV